MFKKCLIAIVTLSVVALATTACKLPTADEMRQPDYGSSTEAAVAQEVIDDMAELYDDIRDGVETGDTDGTISQTFSESQFTALIAQKIGGAEGVAISNVLINIEPDVLLMAADLLHNDEVKAVVAEFTLEANTDTVALTLGDFTWGGLLASIVPAAKTKFEEQLNNGLQSAMDDPEVVMSAIPVPEGATVDSIVLSEGEITITGTVTTET